MSESSTDARQERWRNRMMRALRAGDRDATRRAVQRLLAFDPDDADAHFIAGVCALEDKRTREAVTCFTRATELAPDRPDYWAQRAHCLALLGQDAEAMAAVDHAAALPETDAFARFTLGNVMARLGQHAAAVGHFEAAARQMPDNAEFQYQLAQALVYQGDFARARLVAETVLSIDPNHGRAHLVLADLLDGPPPEGRIEQLEAALGRLAGNVDAELIFSHALARTLESDGRTSEAFALWERSKLAKKRAIGYTIDTDRALFAAIEQAFTAEINRDKRPGDPSRAPIFVVGMPRTGTTLVERILSSHSAVAAGGELTLFPSALGETWGGRENPLVDEKALAAALAADPLQIGSRYLKSAVLQVGDAPHFVDKMPLNFLFIGFIRRALPKAKIICLHRNPLDTCVANFRQLFTQQYPHYRYALSLRDTAEYLALFTGLMNHWDQLFPGAICSQSYEALVSEPEPQIRRLFDYLELEFEPDVMRFEENQAPVATASAVQVRRPLYSSAIGSWRRYEQELKPVKQHLVELGLNPEA